MSCSSHTKETRTQSDPIRQFLFLESLGNLFGEDNKQLIDKTRSPARDGIPQANLHISQDQAEFWLQNHASFQWLRFTRPPTFAKSLFLISMKFESNVAFQLKKTHIFF